MFKIGDRVRENRPWTSPHEIGTVAGLDKDNDPTSPILVLFERPHDCRGAFWFSPHDLEYAENGIERAIKCLKRNSK